jgi:hypothetical protein
MPDPRTVAALGRVDRLPEQLAELLGPKLNARPACAGTAPSHDEWLIDETVDQRAARLNRARAVCARCPALQACARSLPDLGADASGVWAGHLLATTTRPPRA